MVQLCHPFFVFVDLLYEFADGSEDGGIASLKRNMTRKKIATRKVQFLPRARINAISRMVFISRLSRGNTSFAYIIGAYNVCLPLDLVYHVADQL